MPDTRIKDLTVVIPCYNGENFVLNAIESCRTEGVPDRQIIVVDDGSTDDTPLVLAPFVEQIQVHRTKNGGASSARNTGLSLTTTPLVIFLDADDIYEGGMLAALAQEMTAQRADLGLGATQVVEAGGIMGPRKTPPPIDDTDAFLEAWLSGQSVQTNSHMWRTEFLRRIGAWREDMKTLEEIEVVARAVLDGARLAVTNVGQSRYIDNGNENRVSTGNSRAVIQSAIDGFAKIEPMLTSAGQKKALGGRYYRQARAAYRQGFEDIGRDALTRARLCGFRGHSGTRGHRILSSILGLKLKETWVRRRK